MVVVVQGVGLAMIQLGFSPMWAQEVITNRKPHTVTLAKELEISRWFQFQPIWEENSIGVYA